MPDQQSIGAIVVGDTRYIIEGEKFQGFVKWLEKEALMTEAVSTGLQDTRTSGVDPKEKEMRDALNTLRAPVGAGLDELEPGDQIG